MAATRTQWRRRWLPPLLVAAGLVVLAGGGRLAWPLGYVAGTQPPPLVATASLEPAIGQQRGWGSCAAAAPAHWRP